MGMENTNTENTNKNNINNEVVAEKVESGSNQTGQTVSSSSNSSELPEELKGWSWAAFLWGGFWSAGHRTWIGLLAFIPWIGVIMVFILGLKGNEWAWKNNKWESVEEFKRVQKKWVKAWFIVFVILLLISGFGIAMNLIF